MFRSLRVVVAAALAAVSLTAVAAPVGHASAPGATGLRLVPVAPCRLVDTRVGVGPVSAGVDLLVSAAAVCGVPEDAAAVVVTAAAVDARAAGWVDVRAAGAAYTGTSLLNFGAGSTVANQSIVELGADGGIVVRSSAAADVLVDVTGYMVPAESVSAGRLVPVPPTRVMDTRVTGARVPVGGSVRVPFPSLPADTMSVAVNVTVVGGGRGFVTAWPAGQPMPLASMLNVAAGETRAGWRLVPVSADGVDLFVSGGGHVIVDLVGFVTGESAAPSSYGLYVPEVPTRTLDTRLPAGPTQGWRIGRGGKTHTDACRMTGPAFMDCTGTGPEIVAGNVTVVSPAGSMYATVARQFAPPGAVSSVNASSGVPVANAFAVDTISNALDVHVEGAHAHVIIDRVGHWTTDGTVANQLGQSDNTIEWTERRFTPLTTSGDTTDCARWVQPVIDKLSAKMASIGAGGWTLDLIWDTGGEVYSDTVLTIGCLQANGNPRDVRFTAIHELMHAVQYWGIDTGRGELVSELPPNSYRSARERQADAMAELLATEYGINAYNRPSVSYNPTAVDYEAARALLKAAGLI